MRSPACLADPRLQRGRLSPDPVSPSTSVPGSRRRRGAHRGHVRPCRQDAFADPIFNYEKCQRRVNRPGFGAVGSTGLPVPGTDISPPGLDTTIRSARCMDLQRQTRHDDSWPRPCRPNRPWMASACSDNLQLGSSEHGRGGFGRVRQTPRGRERSWTSGAVPRTARSSALLRAQARSSPSPHLPALGLSGN